MLCTACGTPFVPKRHQEGLRFCSNKCRAAFWRKRKVEFHRGRKRKVRNLLEEALEVLGEGEDST